MSQVLFFLYWEYFCPVIRMHIAAYNGGYIQVQYLKLVHNGKPASINVLLCLAIKSETAGLT